VLCIANSRYSTTPFISSNISSAKAIFPPKEEESHVDQINSYRDHRHCNTRPRLQAFAASYGGLSNDGGSMMSSYYDKNGWHLGLPPGARAALAAPQQQSARPGSGLLLYAGRSRGSTHAVPGANGPAASGAGVMSGEVLQNDWFWSGSHY
jgi:hypothetical protein